MLELRAGVCYNTIRLYYGVECVQILITNDDGILAQGIRVLADVLREEHEVIIVAPNMERSGAGHSFTLTSPLRMEETAIPGLPVPAYAVNGTPVDCVKLGYGNLGVRPDMIISGINHGANLGTDTFYSGTVAAAMEGGLLHLPAMAVSVCSITPTHFEPAARFAMSMIPQVMAQGQSVLNINVPDLPAEKIKGCRFTVCSRQEYENEYVERIDTRNHKYFWIPSHNTTPHTPDEDTDQRWTRDGYIAVVPLLRDLTDHNALQRWRELQSCD